jgi:hypothetical protein
MKDYDPKIPLLREMLALSIIGKLEECGFERLPNPREAFGLSRPELAERIYTRTIGTNDRMQVRVYTTVIGGDNGVPFQVRAEGKDAIRVCATYTTKDGKNKGLSKETRINRTGNIADIVDRMHQRMRSAYKTGTNGEKCRSCGAPKFVTKNNKLACAEICWLTDEEKQASNISYESRNRRKRGSRYRRW